MNVNMPFTISDSIALAILNPNALITGIGNELHLYTSDKTSKRVLPVKLRGKVHGIVYGTAISCNQLLVYGEKEYLILSFTKDYSFETVDGGFVTDWISAAIFLKEPNNIVLLTAHSTAVCLKYCPDKRKCEISQRSSCSDKSTLYSALMHGDQWSQLVCFGGNAYGELLIWRPTASRAPLIHRISSHNGVIFSINYSAAASMLTTTSDDRSIRFWRAEMQGSSEEWSETKLIPVASGFGHLARVFQAKIIKYELHFYAVTVGEDSYLCIWRMTGELIYKSRQQFGAIIWNLEYDETNKIIYTVGSTGNVLPFNLPDIIDNEDNSDGYIRERNVAMLLPRPTNNYMKTDNIPSEHYVAKLKLLNPCCLVALTNKNQFICYRNESTWDLIDDFTSTKCTVLEVKQNKIAVCGYKRLTLYKYEEITSGLIEKYYDCDNILDGLIRAFIFLTPEKYIICDDRGNCLLLQESLDGSSKQQSISLPKCKEPWLTCAILVQMDFLVVTNRQGNMFLYRWNTEEEKFNLVFTLKHPHGHLGATLIKLVADSAETALFQSAGHDSTIKYIKLCKSEATLKITKRENVPVSWVKALEPIEELRVELLLGFNDNHFVIWSKLYDFHLQLSCGGGHRYWDYYIYEKPTKIPRIKIVFIKNKQVILYDRKLLSNIVINPVLKLPLRNMWHTRPCNILKFLESAHRENTSVIISGGDDNVIKISIYNNVEGVSHEALRQINEVQSHISNIRAMVVLKVKGDDYLIFTGGGRAQLCVTKLNTNSLEFEEMLNISLKTLSDDSTSGSNYKYFAIDPEVRIMSLDVLPSMIDGGEDKGYIVFIGCSDGFVRKYKIDEYWQISLLGDIHYGKCILQVRLVGQQFLLIAATDGFINYCSLDLAHFDKLIQHHLSGINAMDIHYSYQKQELQVLTGGDDQAMVFSKLFISSTCMLPTVLETVRFETLHTAQVTAVQLSSCGYYAFSGSVDQNLLMTDLRTGKVIKEFHTCVADIKGLCVDSCDKACILYGCGMQIYSFN